MSLPAQINTDFTLIVGATGTGKTFIAKEIIQKARQEGQHVVIYDVQNDFRTAPGIEVIKAWDADVKDVVKYVEKRKETFLYIEEASQLYPKHAILTRDELALFVGRRHRRNGGVLLFHSLRQIPLDIWNNVQGMYLHRTSDKIGTVRCFGDAVQDAWKVISLGQERRIYIENY